MIPADQSEEEIDSYGGKDFQQKKDDSGKRHEKGQQWVSDQSMTTEKSWVMMMDQNDKEHEE